MTEDLMIGWHHRLDGHEFEQALGVGDGQGGLVCCSPWGCTESDTTESHTHTHAHTHTDTHTHAHTHISSLGAPACSAHCADLRTCQSSNHMSQLHIINHFIKRDSYGI